jgi:hypothetical protein
MYRTPENSWGYAITLAMSAKRPKGRWVVYERRKGEFIFLSRLFATRAQAEKEREKLEATFTYKKVSFGVGVVKVGADHGSGVIFLFSNMVRAVYIPPCRETGRL